jgi:urease subunit gamma/beta
MRLLPSEQERLMLFLAAELARARRARGVLLNQAEATAIIADEVCEAAREGSSHAQARTRGRSAVREADVLDGVRGLVPRIEVDALFADGRRLVVLEDPIGDRAPEDPAEPPVPWLEGAVVALDVVNEGDVPVAVTSHFHFFEVNRALCFERARAYGMRLAVPARTKLFFASGEKREVRLLPIGGARVVRGHGGLVDGPLDAPGAREAALALARERGYRHA